MISRLQQSLIRETQATKQYTSGQEQKQNKTGMTSRSSVRAQVWRRGTKQTFCSHHEGQKAMFVCMQPGCDLEFACTKCITTNHRGHNVDDLAEVVSKKKDILKTKVKTGNDVTLTSLLEQIKYADDEIVNNKSKTKEEQDKIYHRCNEMKTELDKICEEYTELCKQTGETNDRKLKIYKDRLQSLYNEYKAELKERNEDIDKCSDSDIVLIETTEFAQPPSPPNLPEIKKLHFKFNVTLNSGLKKCFGELVSMKNKHSMIIGTDNVSPDETNIVIASPENVQCTAHFFFNRDSKFNCHCLKPVADQVCVWFYQSETVSYVNKDGKVLHTVNLEPGIDGLLDNVCPSSVDDTLWYFTTRFPFTSCVPCIRQITPDGALLQSLTLDKGTSSLCVTRNGSLVVGVHLYPEYKVQILTSAGDVAKSVKVTDIGLRESPSYIAQCPKTGRISVSDKAGVSVMDENLGHLYTIYGETVKSADGRTEYTGYKPGKIFVPASLCFDEDGDLLVIDLNNYSVIMFNSSGQYTHTIIRERKENIYPCVINTTLDGELWVAYSNDVINRIKYKSNQA